MSGYDQQRQRRTPPHVPLASLRGALGLTLDEVCRRISEENPRLKPTRGAISAIEHGHRGASEQMLAALATAYGLPADAVVTDYEPRQREAVPA